MSDRTPEEWREVRIARGWHAANCGTGKRIWFCCRETRKGMEYHYGPAGNLIRLGSYESAQRRADLLNGAQA